MVLRVNWLQCLMDQLTEVTWFIGLARQEAWQGLPHLPRQQNWSQYGLARPRSSCSNWYIALNAIC